MDKVAPCKVCEVLEESGCMKDVTTVTGCAVSCTRARSLSFTLDAVALRYIHSLGILKLSWSQAKCCDFGVRITAQIMLSALTLVLGAQPQITVFAGQLAANHSFFQDKSQNGGAKSQFRSHFLAGGRLDLS